MILPLQVMVLTPLFGLVAGFWLGKIANEEVKLGEAYFRWLRRVIILVIVLVLVYLSPLSWVSLAVFLVGIGAGAVARFRFLYLGMAAVVAWRIGLEIVVLILSLVLVYSLPFGTQKIGKTPVAGIAKHMGWYLLGFVLIWFPVSHVSFLAPFVAGAMLLRE